MAGTWSSYIIIWQSMMHICCSHLPSLLFFLPPSFSRQFFILISSSFSLNRPIISTYRCHTPQSLLLDIRASHYSDQLPQRDQSLLHEAQWRQRNSSSNGHPRAKDRRAYRGLAKVCNASVKFSSPWPTLPFNLTDTYAYTLLSSTPPLVARIS